MRSRGKELLLLAMLLSLFSQVASAADKQLEAIERRIVKEPKYESKPQYLLLALGLDAKTRVWVVEDGRKLYIDKNANGDLTDDGDPLTPSNERKLNTATDSTKANWDFEYLLLEFGPSGEPKHKDFNLRRWNYWEAEGDSYGLSLTLDGKVPMYAGWTKFWAKSPEKASIVHFGGPLTPRSLRSKQFTVGAKMSRLSFGFMNPGLDNGADARLSIEAIASDVVPLARIQWPTKEGDPPLETTHRLDHRCCYWEFYMLDFEVPKNAIAGTATVTLELPLSAMPLVLATDTIKIPVLAAETTAASEK